MSNLGLHVYAREQGMNLECTERGRPERAGADAGEGLRLGGEQSGHMIFLDHATTGDGQLTALQILALLKSSGKKASELFGGCPRYPQVLINVPVADNDVKKAVMASSGAGPGGGAGGGRAGRRGPGAGPPLGHRGPHAGDGGGQNQEDRPGGRPAAGPADSQAATVRLWKRRWRRGLEFSTKYFRITLDKFSVFCLL